MDASPSVKIASSYVGGRLRVFYDEITLATSEIINGFHLARLPVGAVVYDFVLAHDALNETGGTITLGDNVKLDRYTVVEVDVVGFKSMVNDGRIEGFGYKITEETRDIFSVGFALVGNFNGKLKCSITYALD